MTGGAQEAGGLAEALRRLERSGDGPLDERLLERLAVHFELLARWNRTHNLTRVDSVRDAAQRHYGDCLAAAEALERAGVVGDLIFDIGSGGGFPGLVWGALWPERRVVLVEPRRKRCSFLLEAARLMELDAVEVRQARGEEITAHDGALVTSRATFSPESWGRFREALARIAGPTGHVALFLSGDDERGGGSQRGGERWVPYTVGGLAVRGLSVAPGA